MEIGLLPAEYNAGSNCPQILVVKYDFCGSGENL